MPNVYISPFPVNNPSSHYPYIACNRFCDASYRRRICSWMSWWWDWQYSPLHCYYKIFITWGLPSLGTLQLLVLRWKLCYRIWRGEGEKTPESDNFENAEGVLIKGTGQNPAQTVLNAIIEWFPVNVMFENLTINGKQSTEQVYYTDGGKSILFRRCVLIVGNLSTAWRKTAVIALTGRVTFIDSEIINGYPSATGITGVWSENSVTNNMNLMRSSIEEFPVGLLGRNWGPDTQNSIQVHKTTLSSNTIGK